MLRKGEKKEVLRHLVALGCTEREGEIYLKCLETGQATVQELANRLGENRVTVHSAVQTLMTKGLLAESRKGRKRVIHAESPTAIYALLDRKEKEVSNLRSAADPIIQMLSTIKPPDGHLPSVEFYEDSDGFKKMLERTLNARGEFLAVINVDLFGTILEPSYLQDFFERRAKKGIRSRLIWPEGVLARKLYSQSKRYKTQIRVLETALSWSSGIISWNHCLSIKSFSQGRVTCTILENEDIAHFFRNILFEQLWNTALPMRPK